MMNQTHFLSSEPRQERGHVVGGEGPKRRGPRVQSTSARQTVWLRLSLTISSTRTRNLFPLNFLSTDHNSINSDGRETMQTVVDADRKTSQRSLFGHAQKAKSVHMPCTLGKCGIRGKSNARCSRPFSGSGFVDLVRIGICSPISHIVCW